MKGGEGESLRGGEGERGGGREEERERRKTGSGGER